MPRYSLLLGRMKEKGINQKELAKLVNRNVSTINQKLNMKGEFTQSEIQSICFVLNIPIEEVGLFFLTQNLLNGVEV